MWAWGLHSTAHPHTDKHNHLSPASKRSRVNVSDRAESQARLTNMPPLAFVLHLSGTSGRRRSRRTSRWGTGYSPEPRCCERVCVCECVCVSAETDIPPKCWAFFSFFFFFPGSLCVIHLTTNLISCWATMGWDIFYINTSHGDPQGKTSEGLFNDIKGRFTSEWK